MVPCSYVLCCGVSNSFLAHLLHLYKILIRQFFDLLWACRGRDLAVMQLLKELKVTITEMYGVVVNVMDSPFCYSDLNSAMEVW